MNQQPSEPKKTYLRHESSVYRRGVDRRSATDISLKSARKEARRAAGLGSEQGKDSVKFYDTVDSKEAEVIAASKEFRQQKLENSRLSKAFARGITPEMGQGLIYAEYRTPDDGYCDYKTMEARNAGADTPIVEVFEPGRDEELRVSVRTPAAKTPWPPVLIVKGTELMWPSRGVECLRTISLRREGLRCHLVVDGVSQGSWFVTRKTDSDVLSNILSIALWGTTDVPISMMDNKTPDSFNHETRTSYEMKVSRKRSSRFDPSVTINEAVRKYSPYSSGGVRVVLYRQGNVWSNYNWADDDHSVHGGHVFACCIQAELPLFETFSKLFDSPSLGGQSNIEDYGKSPLVVPENYDEDQHDYLKPHHLPLLKKLAERAEDGLDWETIRAIPDDPQDQHPRAVAYLEAIAEKTSRGNNCFREDGTFKAKITSFPLFGYRMLTMLFKPNPDCDVPFMLGQEPGSTEEAIMKLFEIVSRERNPGPEPTEQQREAKRRWESVDPAVQYGKSMNTELIVNEDKVIKLMAKLMQLREHNSKTQDELRSERASILDKISELVYVSVEQRVKRARKCVMSAPEKIGGSTDTYEGEDCVSSGFIESSYHAKKRAERRAEERMNPETYVASQKNLPFVKDDEIDLRMEKPLGPSICPQTASQEMIDRMNMVEEGRDSNYDLLFTMDKVVQEANISMGHKTGPGIFIKPIPHTRCWLMMRNSGQQCICYLIIDTEVHYVDEPKWWSEISGSTLLRSKPFTISKAKAEMYINSEEMHRTLCCMRSLELREESLTKPERERSLTVFSNLVTIILASQRQPDSVILSYARYIGMILRNNNLNRGPVADIFGKVERIKSRLSLWTLRKFLAWVAHREENSDQVTFMVDGVETGTTNWKTRCWLTLYPAESGQAIATSYYLGNIYAKTLGEAPAANRGPMDKLLTLAYAASDGKEQNLETPGTGVNKIGEELSDYSRHFQVDYGLLTKVIQDSWAHHERKHPGWKRDFETEFDRITSRADGQRYATNRSSMEHHSDSSIDGYTVTNQESGRVQTTNIRSRNRTRKMKHMVARYPKVFLGHPLKNLSNLWTRTRVYMVPKKQLQGKREILILTPGSRLFISSLESVMRALADGMENEVLTNKHKEEKISSYASYINLKRSKLSGNVPFVHVRSRSSADATKWCQLFRMSVFMVMTELILKEAYPTLADHCLSVLYEHVQKKIQIPPTILREILANNPFNEKSIQRLADEFRQNTSIHNMGECMVKIVDNMLQGILHYTSSVFHSLIQNYFTERVRCLMNDKMMEIALRMFSEDKRVQAEGMMEHFNGRSDRAKTLEEKMWSEGSTREEIDRAIRRIREETSESREWLMRNINGRRADKLVPSWDFTYQNAASSDDTSIAMDIIITGPPSFLKEAMRMATFIFTKVVKAKRTYYMRLGIEESASKSSVGNFRDEMEFNSKWYEGPVVIDVVLKQVLSALRPPSVTGLGLMQTHYVNGRTAVIGVGGSVELVRQVEIAQARMHWKILGCDMSDMFPLLCDAIKRNPHPLVGMFTHERNPALAGLMPEFMIRYQWLQDRETAETEQALSMTVDHEMDPTGIVTVSLKIEVGNGLRSKESMIESGVVCDNFIRDVLKTDDPIEYLENNALSFLSGTASSLAKLLLELEKDRHRPIETDVTSTSVYKLSTLLIAAPCISVRLPSANTGKRVVLRMSLPAVLRMIEAQKTEAVEKGVRLLDTMCSNESFSRSLMGLRVGKPVDIERSLANRAVSTTRQTMAGIPAELDHKAALFRLWSGSREPDVISAYRQIRTYLKDVRKTMESSIERMKGYGVDTKMALVSHITAKTDLVYTVRSRGGTGLYTSVYDAIVKVLEVQSYQSRVCDVYQWAGVDEDRESGFDNFRYEANMGAFFPSPEMLRDQLSSCHLSDPLSVSVSRDMKMLSWAQTVLAEREDRAILESASVKTPILVSLASRGKMVLVAGRLFLQLNIRQSEKSAVVLSCETNASRDALTYLFSALRLKKKKWLTWPGEEDPSEAQYYYTPEGGVSQLSHAGSTPVWHTTNKRSWGFDTLIPVYRKYGGRTKISLRLTNRGAKWDFVDISIPTGSIRSTEEQRKRLRTACSLKAVHFPTMDLICSGGNLTHSNLNDWLDASRSLKAAWKILMQRSIRLIQMGGINFMRWSEAQVIVGDKELWRLKAFELTSFSGTALDKASPEFQAHSLRLKAALTASGYSPREQEAMVSEGETLAVAGAIDENNDPLGWFDDDDETGVVSVVFRQEDSEGAQERDETFEGISSVAYMPKSIDVTVSTGMPIESFGSIITKNYREGDRVHRGAYYLTKQDVEDEEEEGFLG